MKKTMLFALIAVLALSLCACRMGNNHETTTVPTTEPVVTTTEPVTTMPTMPNPTIETNIPDTNVDDDHMIDTTEGAINGTTGDTTPNIRRYFN